VRKYSFLLIQYFNVSEHHWWNWLVESNLWEGCVVAQAVSRWLPTATVRVRVRATCGGLWWTKRHWCRFSPSTSVSLANHHFTNFSIIMITRGWNNRPISGRSAEWTQLDSTPPLYQLKRTNGDSWLRLALCNRHKRLCLSCPLSWGKKQVHFQIVCVC
jgi:hypothetical protein